IGHDNCRLEPTIAAVIAAEGEYEGGDNNYSPNVGNADLKEETADTTTLGVTLAPEFLDGFRISLDYYDISVKDAINSISNSDLMRGCYDSPAGNPWDPDNRYCSAITRDDDGEIVEIMQVQYNLDEEAARGFDVAADYRYNIGDWGYLRFKFDYGHVIEHSETHTDTNIQTQTSVVVKTDQEGTIAYGVWEDKASFSTAWYNDDWRVRWKIYWKGPVIRNHENLEDWNEYMDVNDEACANSDPDCIENPEPLMFQNYPSYVKHNFSLSYNQDLGKSGDLRYFFGVNNVFNNKGGFYPFATSNYVGRFGNGVGRFIYAGAEYKY
ncbi:MAG: TonB-dependent receptor, partial [Gammaproteobacteria bacterium]|nr:TonB-dependent receptor [Gammaproteobacteria bacterium]